MTLKKTLQFTMIALALTIGIGAQAKPKDAPSITLNRDVTVAGAHLASGKYNVQWQTHSPEATVTFSHGSKVVATAEGKLLDRGVKYGSDEVVYDETADGGRVVQEIRFKGSSEVLVFNE